MYTNFILDICLVLLFQVLNIPRGMFCYNLMNLLVWTRSYPPQTTGEYISEVCFVTIWWTYLYEQDLTLHKQLENIYQRYVLLQSDERTCMNKILPSTNNWRIYIRGMFCYNLMNVLVWPLIYILQLFMESKILFIQVRSSDCNKTYLRYIFSSCLCRVRSCSYKYVHQIVTKHTSDIYSPVVCGE
jgi:hypothetical protein